MTYIHVMDYSCLIELSNAEFLSFREKYSLLKEYGTAESIFRASYNELYEKAILTPSKINKLIRIEHGKGPQLELESAGIKLCSIFDKEYPRQLLSLYSPPIMLYYKGKLPKQTCISIVGSRRTTANGRQNAFASAELLAGFGYCIVSGMARGIDSCAHLGALERGTTAAILGNGLNICYPPENEFLMKCIEDKGCVISEFPTDKKPSRYTFPARNRIISGLSEAVIVVEAAKKSGSLITADFALEQGKDVLVFENKSSELSEGTDSLISEGAYPLASVSVLKDIYGS